MGKEPILSDASSSAAWSAIFWVLTYLTIATVLQYSIPYPLDDDTAYHFVVGQLIGKYGILHSFPWTPFSLQFDQYADKEFLFHLLFVPLGGMGFIPAARLVGALTAALLLTVLYLILRSGGVRQAGIWALVPLACGEFLFRIALVRPHLLSITLALVVLWAYTTRRLRILAIAAILYPLSYVAFWQIPLILIIASEAARLLSGKRFEWKPPVTVLCGILIGIAVHPNSLNLLKINWLHMSDVLFSNAWGGKPELALGKELNPYPLVDWARYLVLVVVMMGVGTLAAWRQRKENWLPLAFGFAAVCFGLLTIKSMRFIEYFVPLSVAACALAATAFRTRFAAPVALGASLGYLILFGTTSLAILTSPTESKDRLDPQVAAYFAQQIPVGAQVFTCGWDYTGSLMLALPERKFIVAADPTLFYKKDPALYKIWYEIPLRAPLDSAEAIRRLFRSRYVVSLNYQAYWAFFNTLLDDPKVTKLFADDRWVLFDLGEP